MKARYPFIRYAGICVLLFTALTLSACGITAANRSRISPSTNTPEPSNTPERPTATLTIPSFTPIPHNTTIATAIASNLWPGFTATVTALPNGFPILPQARFVAYNPAYDPCAVGNRGCAVQAFPPQVWLYELSFPPDSEVIGRSVADEYTKLLETAGYQVETTLSDDATRLTFTGPAGASAGHGYIEVGPSVRPFTSPLNGRIIGIRIVVNRLD